MKVGILTYHRAHNYGAVLQCYALQELIREFGQDVEIIDYRQPFIEKLYGFSKQEWFRKNLFHPRSLLKFNKIFREKRQKASIYSNFRETFLNLSQQVYNDSIPDYNLYIVGSDQMWSINCVGNKVDNVYFGNFRKKAGSKLIGFSISSNLDSISKISKDLREHINRFDDISFREDIITDEVNNQLDSHFITTLDPTLCANQNIWDKIIDSSWEKRPKYIVLYHVKLRFGSIVHDLLLKQAQRLAALHDLEVVDLSTGDNSIVDFVSAIKYSQIVLTSSFHGTVFAVIFNRPLFTVKLHDGGDGRYVSLLQSLGMNDSLIDLDFDNQFPALYDESIINERLKSLRETSINYLSAYL